MVAMSTGTFAFPTFYVPDGSFGGLYVLIDFEHGGYDYDEDERAKGLG